MRLPKRVPSALLAFVLSLAVTLEGCSAAWVKTAVGLLPVVTQIALNIVALQGAVMGTPPSPVESAAIQQLSSEATRDLKLIQKLYDEYEAAPGGEKATKKQAIINAIQTLQGNLPALLTAFHISNADLQARIGASVQLILSMVATIAAAIPGAPVSMKAAKVGRTLTAAELKAKYNAEICRGAVACTIP